MEVRTLFPLCGSWGSGSSPSAEAGAFTLKPSGQPSFEIALRYS